MIQSAAIIIPKKATPADTWTRANRKWEFQLRLKPPPVVLGFGIYAGGWTVTTADKADYAAGTTAAASGYNLSQARSHLAAAGNASFGIYAGGLTDSNVTTADKADYVAGTTSAASEYNLSEARRGLAAASNSNPGSM